MCIAILNKQGTIDLQTFNRCWQSNPDGGGFAYYDGAKVQIVKEMSSVKKLHKAYKKLRSMYSSPFIIHFRISTHGKVNLTNCHPFRISETAAFIHNGIISETAFEGDYSDTYNFNEVILQQLPERILTSDALSYLLAKYIDYSKLCILVKDKAVIINEELGAWDGDNWYSNDSYKDKPKYEPPKYTRYNYKSYETGCDCCGYSYGSRYYGTLSSYLCNECAKMWGEETKQYPKYYDELN